MKSVRARLSRSMSGADVAGSTAGTAAPPLESAGTGATLEAGGGEGVESFAINDSTEPAGLAGEAAGAGSVEECFPQPSRKAAGMTAAILKKDCVALMPG